MVWYKYLYMDENIIRKKEKIKWKICHNAGMLDIFVITLSQNDSGLLEIISTIELMQKTYPKKELFIVGLAKGYETARILACNIIMEVYQQTGDFHVKTYLLQKHYADKKQVCL